MAITPEQFSERLEALRVELGEQGRRVRRLVQLACDSFIRHEEGPAREALTLEESVDRLDVHLEKRAVALLVEAAGDTTPLGEGPIRGVLTLVKVNNELERIADCGVSIAERALALGPSADVFPPTSLVMTNSVVGLLRDVATAYLDRNAKLARLVLQSEDAVGEFKAQVLRQTEEAVAAGKIGVAMAFELQELAVQCALMADHATNIAEQVIYDATGVIVRHQHGRWVIDDTGPA